MTIKRVQKRLAYNRAHLSKPPSLPNQVQHLPPPPAQCTAFQYALALTARNSNTAPNSSDSPPRPWTPHRLRWRAVGAGCGSLRTICSTSVISIHPTSMIVISTRGHLHPYPPIIARGSEDRGISRVPRDRIDGAIAVALECGDLEARLSAPDMHSRIYATHVRKASSPSHFSTLRKTYLHSH